MTRDEMKAFLELSRTISSAVQFLPYREALPALNAIQEMAFLVTQDLPGGYAGECPQCEEIKGEDELVDCGDERICQSCVDEWEKKYAATPTPQAREGK